MDIRLIAYFALAFVMLLLYEAWQQDYGAKIAYTPPEIIQSVDAPPAEDLPEINTLPVDPATNVTTPVINKAIASSNSQNLITIETDVLRLSLDLQGGTIVRSELLQYPKQLDTPEDPVVLLTTTEHFYIAQSGLQATKQAAPDHYAQYQSAQSHYKLGPDATQLEVPLIWEDASGIQVIKRLILQRNSYAITVKHEVINNSDQIWQGRQYRQLQRDALEEGKNRFIYTFTGAILYSPEQKYEKIDFAELAEQPLKRNFADGWFAMIQHYFLTAWIPNPAEINNYYSRGLSDQQSGERYIVGASSPLREIQPGEQGEFSSQLFVGPKLQEVLKATAPGLVLTVDYGLFTILADPLFWLLDTIYDWVGNWGWAIIFLTILIKLVFYKLAEISYRSMANMRRVQPKLLAIRERYANDRARQSQAMMELYKQEKINPLGGCLPMIIQIPVFIALYWVLLESVEMRQAPFMLWIQDLSTKDPYYILPLIMGITMYIQQKLNPAPIDPVQAKVFMVLPFVFTIFFAFFPAGLVLYWVVNNILTILQQWLITRHVLKNN